MKPLFSTQNLGFLHMDYPDLEIPLHLATFLTGESGSGKSTLLKLINCTKLPERGGIYYHGLNIAERDPIVHRREVVLVPQEVFLLDGTIRENLDFYTQSREEPTIAWGEFAPLLEVCCAPFSEDTLCANLSGGERQRVFLAIFLALRPIVLLLDEPTAALDQTTAETLFRNLMEHCARAEITPITVCHTPALVEQFSQNTIFLTASPRQGGTAS